MKTLFHYIPLAVVFCISLFFACTSEIELPLSPANKFGTPSEWCAYPATKQCYKPAPSGKCYGSGGELVQECPYSSSSGGGGSSSSGVVLPEYEYCVFADEGECMQDEGPFTACPGGGELSDTCPYNSSSSGDENSSSSSSGASSSSGNHIDPVITGSFEFRNFDYSSSSSKIYFLGTYNMHMSDTPSPGGNGKLYNSLAITNAAQAECGAITVEVTGLEGLTTMPTAPLTPSPVTTPGIIRAYAVATCAGKTDTLRIDSATVVPDPIISDCSLPSTYVYKSEPVKNLVTVSNAYGRCTDATYSPATYPSSASTTASTFSTTASCGTHTKLCSLPGLIVANQLVDFVEKDTHYPITNSGSTVIKMPITDPLQNRLGCAYTTSGTNNIVFTLTVNGIRVNSVGTQNYWTNSAKFEPTYITNGDRILFETTINGLECATTHVD